MLKHKKVFDIVDSFKSISSKISLILFIFALFLRYQGDGSTHSAVMPTDGSTVDIVAGIFLFTSVFESNQYVIYFSNSLFQPNNNTNQKI